MRWVPVGLPRWVAAVSVGVLTYLTVWGAAYVLNLIGAQGSQTQLPPPGAWVMRAIYLLIAVAVAAWTTARATWTEHELETAIAAAVVLSFVTGLVFLVSEHHRRSFEAALPSGEDRASALVAGHEACDWLSAQHWGEPPYEGGPTSGSFAAPALRLQYEPPHSVTPGWQNSNSTRRLFVSYVEHLDDQDPAALSTDDKYRARYAMVAFYELCPLQQFVHRPVGGGGVGGGGD